MSERFTVMELADQEARRFNHEYIGTEHILLGLVKERTGVAANVLENLGIDLRKVRLEVDRIVQPGPDMFTIGKLPQTPRAKKVIEYSIEEARNLNQNHVGTEHLMLGLLREQEGVAAPVLMNLGLTLDDVRQELLNFLEPSSGRSAPGRNTSEAVKDLPAEVRRADDDLDAQIARLNGEKEAAVAEQDFERAAQLRDQGDNLLRRKAVLLREWVASHPAEASWLWKNEAKVARMARAIGDKRSWHELPNLADALVEAGCTDAEILSHCRQPGEHATRCWVVDLLLGKL
jgi:ATP-dependent Clp protease ATP-binding subunit ClpA